MNDQRKVIFEQRLDIMGEDDVSETVKDLRHQLVNELVRTHIPESAYAEQWNTPALKEAISGVFGIDLPIEAWAAEGRHRRQEIAERILKEVDEKAERKAKELGDNNFRQIEKMVLLQTLDHLWREHLVTLEHLRQVIGFRAYGQRDPLNEYKSEAFVAVRGDAGQPARGGDRAAHAHRAGVARGSGRPAAGRRPAGDARPPYRPVLRAR